MRFHRTVALWAAAVAAQQTGDGSSFSAGARTPVSSDVTGVVPGRYIVEVAPSLQGRRGESGVAAVVQDMQAKGYEATVREDFSAVSSRFSGGSIEVSDAGTSNSSVADELLKIPAVTNVWPVHEVALNTSFRETNQATWAPHAATRVSALHAQGWTGQGQTVCVIDSGIDAAHPALQGRVAGGRNMIDTGDGSADAYSTDCVGHGTFVSSVLVGNHTDLVGVAPGAQVYMYKVFACAVTTTTDLVLKGLLAADADGCDIVSMSIGSGSGYRYAVTSRVAAEVAADRLVIIAAGNDGAAGAFYASSPAVAEGVLSVGSVEAAQVIAWPAQLVADDGAVFDVAYVTKDGAKFNQTIDVAVDWDAGDSCNLVGSTAAADRAVLVRKGVCLERFAARQIEAAGYQYGVVFDTYDQGVFYADDIVEYYYGALQLYASTAARVGDWAAAHNASALRLVIQADAQPVATDATDLEDIPQAGQVSATSSWGPSFENDLSPQVLAPGGSVFGAYPNGVFGVGSGTSFSTPYVAGLAALVYAHGSKDKEAFKKRLVSTSHALPAYNELDQRVRAQGVPGPVAQQGAGLIDASAFLTAASDVLLTSAAVLPLNDTDNRVGAHTIQLYNAGRRAVWFNVTHVPSVSIESRNALLYPYEYYPPLAEGVYGALQAPTRVRVPAGETVDVPVTLTAPAGVDPALGLLWSGKVVFQSDAQALSVPYLGVEASTYEWGALHHGPESYYYDQNSGYLYPVDHLGRDAPYRPLEGSSPEIWFAIRYGAYEFSLDIVGADYDPATDFVYPPVPATGPRAWYGAIRQQVDPSYTPTDFPMRELVRFSNGGYVTFHSLANGTAIPSGRYRILSRALRMFGDYGNPKDWQLFVSDPFWVQNGDDPLPEAVSTVSSVATSSTSSASSASSASSTTSATSSLPTVSSETAPVTSSTVSLSATSVVPTTVTSVSGPTTTLTAAATPTGGLEDVVTLSLQTYQDASTALTDTAAWMELHVQISIPEAVPAGAQIHIGVPAELEDFPTDASLQASNGLVGSLTWHPDTHTLSIALQDWTTWHKNMHGDFYLMCRFASAYAAAMAPGTYVLEFAVASASTAGATLQAAIAHTAVDRTQVYEHQTVEDYPPNSGLVFIADIEVPAALGPWDAVQLLATLVDDDGFLCAGQSGVFVGYASLCPSQGNRITDRTLLQDVSNSSLLHGEATRCDVKNYLARYEQGLDGDRHVLRFRVAGIQGDSAQWTYSFTYALDIELSNGTTVLYPYKTVSFEKNPRKRIADFYDFYGDRS